MKSKAAPSAGFETVLAALQADSLRCFGTSQITLRPRRVFAGPFSRVLEVEVFGTGQPLTVFVKVVKPRADTAEELQATGRNVTREFETLTKVQAALLREPQLAAPRPVACYPELHALVTQRLEGEPLARVLSTLRGVPSSSAIDRVVGVMRNVALWLNTFQAMDEPGSPVSLERMRSYLDARLRPLAELRVCSWSLREGLLAYFDWRARDVPAGELTSRPVHADFTPENVIVGTGSIGVLDFTMAKQGARYLDVAHLYMQIEMLKARPWFRPAVIDLSTTALLSGYDNSLQADRPLFDLLLMQNVVCSVLQTAQTNVTGSIPARLLAEHVRRRQLKWLAARAARVSQQV
jgi:aminoglycoside phosphotransferase (APT) family kinase protein